MNIRAFDNRESTIAITLVATIYLLFVAPSSLTIPAYALGHWHGGDAEIHEDSADTISTEDREKLVSCLANTQEGSISTQDEIKYCLNTIREGEEDTEDNSSINDDDGITVSDDDPENSDSFSSIDKDSSDIAELEDNPQSNEDTARAE